MPSTCLPDLLSCPCFGLARQDALAIAAATHPGATTIAVEGGSWYVKILEALSAAANEVSRHMDDLWLRKSILEITLSPEAYEAISGEAECHLLRQWPDLSIEKSDLFPAGVWGVILVRRCSSQESNSALLQGAPGERVKKNVFRLISRT